MNYKTTTTLNDIRAKYPCVEGWETLLKSLGKTKADDEPLELLTILDNNGVYDALWVLDRVIKDDQLIKDFREWCIDQVRERYPKCGEFERKLLQEQFLANRESQTDQLRKMITKSAA